jgi:hypothetical protein
LGGTTWALIAEIDESEAFASVNLIAWLIGIIAVIGIVAITLVALLIARAITNPINAYHRRFGGRLRTGGRGFQPGLRFQPVPGRRGVGAGGGH